MLPESALCRPVFAHLQWKPKSCHDVNFMITIGITGCHGDNLQSNQWWPTWHHDNSWFSVCDKFTGKYHNNIKFYLYYQWRKSYKEHQYFFSFNSFYISNFEYWNSSPSYQHANAYLSNDTTKTAEGPLILEKNKKKNNRTENLWDKFSKEKNHQRACSIVKPPLNNSTWKMPKSLSCAIELWMWIS